MLQYAFPRVQPLSQKNYCATRADSMGTSRWVELAKPHKKPQTPWFGITPAHLSLTPRAPCGIDFGELCQVKAIPTRKGGMAFFTAAPLNLNNHLRLWSFVRLCGW